MTFILICLYAMIHSYGKLKLLIPFYARCQEYYTFLLVSRELQ